MSMSFPNKIGPGIEPVKMKNLSLTLLYFSYKSYCKVDELPLSVAGSNGIWNGSAKVFFNNLKVVVMATYITNFRPHLFCHHIGYHTLPKALCDCHNFFKREPPLIKILGL